MLLQELAEDRKVVGQIAQRGCAVFIPGYFQDSSGSRPKQPVLVSQVTLF